MAIKKRLQLLFSEKLQSITGTKRNYTSYMKNITSFLCGRPVSAEIQTFRELVIYI